MKEAESIETRNGAKRLPQLLAAAALVLLTFALHGSALRGWWTEDDPQILLQAGRENAAEMVVRRELWRDFSSSNFVPLFPLSYRLDYVLAGLNPFWFYVHHLAALGLATAALFLLMAGFTRRWIAFAAALGFVVSPAGMYAAHTLMVRHYVEGIIAAALAVWFWTRRKKGSAWLAAALYFAAALAKEVFAPLPLLFIAESMLRRESIPVLIRRLMPSCATALIYLLWRTVMLGSLGGYGSELSLHALAVLPLRVWRYTAGLNAWLGGVIWLAMILLALAALVRDQNLWRLLFGGVLIAAFVFLPLIPMAATLETRLVIIPTAVLAVLVAVAAEKAGRRRVARWMPIGFLIGAAMSGWHESGWLTGEYARMRAEGRYLWNEPSGSRPLLATSSAWYLDGLRALRMTTGRGSSPVAYSSLYGVVLEQTPPESLVEADAQGTIASLSPAKTALARRLAESFRPELSMDVSVLRDGHTLRFDLDPDCEEDCLYLTVPLYRAFPVEERVPHRFPGDRTPPSMFLDGPPEFRIVRKLETKWSATPELTLPEQGQELVRKRDGRVTP